MNYCSLFKTPKIDMYFIAWIERSRWGKLTFMHENFQKNSFVSENFFEISWIERWISRQNVFLHLFNFGQNVRRMSIIFEMLVSKCTRLHINNSKIWQTIFLCVKGSVGIIFLGIVFRENYGKFFVRFSNYLHVIWCILTRAFKK